MALTGFLKDENAFEVLFILPGGQDQCIISYNVPAPDKLKKKGVVALRIKAANEPIDSKNFYKMISFMEINKGLLEHMYQVYHDVYAPVI